MIEIVRIYYCYVIICLLLSDPVQKLTLSSSNLKRTLDYWNGILGMKICEQKNGLALLGYGDTQTKLEFKDIGKGSMLQ